MANYLLASEISWVYIVFGIVLFTTMSIYVVIMAYNNAILTNKLTQKVLRSNVFFPMGIVAVIGKIIGSFYLEYDDIYIWNQDIKYVFIVIIVAVLLNLLLEKLNNKDSSAKTDTKPKSLVPAMGSAAGSEESSPEDDDADSKNKSLWEKVKNFCYNHRTEIAIGVLVIISIILYGQYKKPPTPPTLPTGDKPTPPGPTSEDKKNPQPEGKKDEKNHDGWNRSQKLSEQIYEFVLEDSEDTTYDNVYNYLSNYFKTLYGDNGILYYQSLGISQQEFLVFARTADALNAYIGELYHLGELDSRLTISEDDRLLLNKDQEDLELAVSDLKSISEKKKLVMVNDFKGILDNNHKIERRANKIALVLKEKATKYSI
jgi:hypothetical protein